MRDNFDELEQSDALESGLSMLTDDQRLAYSGQNYEKVLTRVFLALTNLLHDGQDAEAYSLQVNAKQEELLREGGCQTRRSKAALVYTPLAIAPYLRGVIRESTFGNYDDASRAYHQVVSWQPEFQAAQVGLARAQSGVHSQPGHGVLYVFALVNRGPVKEETMEIPTTAAMLIGRSDSVGCRRVRRASDAGADQGAARRRAAARCRTRSRSSSISQTLGQTETICDVARAGAAAGRNRVPAHHGARDRATHRQEGGHLRHQGCCAKRTSRWPTLR